MKNELISIISQAFYGNRTGTEIRRENIDRFILGYQTDDFDVTEPVDRTCLVLTPWYSFISSTGKRSVWRSRNVHSAKKTIFSSRWHPSRK